MITFANVSWSELDDNEYEGVAKFDFSDSQGILVALAIDDRLAHLSIPDGKAAMDAAVVPEPSALLLAMLAAGFPICSRRRRNAVPL